MLQQKQQKSSASGPSGPDRAAPLRAALPVAELVACLRSEREEALPTG